MPQSLPKSKISGSLLELAACEFAFGCFALQAIYSGVAASDAALGTGIIALVFWWGLQLGAPQSVLQPAFVGTGMALLVDSLLAYAGLSAPLSLLNLAGGCVVATVLVSVLKKWQAPHATGGTVLMLGCGAAGSTVVGALGPQLMGLLEDDKGRRPAGAAFLGGFPALSEVVAARQPSTLVLDLPDWDQHLSPRFLLNCKLHGMKLETAATTYERFFQRISVAEYRPFQFWQETLRSNRRVMAFQAIYSNLSGLILLVGLSPVLVVLGLASRLAAGSGPVFENVECAGFQRIPFLRRRFRIHRANGQKTGIGKLISGLRLTNLPQVINLVRGEMGLFGPQPVRTEFAEYLEELSPVFSHRFSLKPGIFGWAQANAGRSGAVQEESVRIGYDLYYLESGSPFLDCEILLRALARSTTAWKG